ncbi:type VI secretion system-associated FHA domain protein TagH [Erwinia sp. S43]|uniref:type VI secretion system-associated FHA domain protein TagH n=1 Tax=Erwinia sp. S43 TaxID=2769339 RepID=UPI00190BEA17|nr:type VI secretion system-associated FHA domain protein TagH [Erwinia sp. S43]MBK0030657.1 type VI secretion system-associated FHA domain protein TagH [Erwinia sp. S43]
MRLTLLNHLEQDVSVSCDFAPPGGTIGRSADNNLVLPDPERTISRLQALVHVSPAGECRLTSQGSVIAVIHNERSLARGEQVRLMHGDTLTIGHYHIMVTDPHRTDDSTVLDDPLLLFNGESSSTEDPLGILNPAMLPDSVQEKPSAEELELRAARDAAARLAINPLPTSYSDNGDPARDGSHEQRLLNALLEGMGLEPAAGQTAELSEEQMRLTGRMLSLFSQGTVALLSSRSILKRGVKAEMTMILNEANNPFKILPSGKTVLMQIYQSQMPGFMPPEQAVRDALVDLQAHQLGMTSGIRAIIAAMLQSFNPQRLEEHARQDSAIPRLALSTSRKAALWDYFLRHYQNTSGDIEDDFHSLFGEAFLQAYEMEVNQYKDSQSAEEDR